MSIIPNRKIWFTFSGTLIVLAILALALWGLKPGIDFTGGSLLELRFPKTVAVPNAEQFVAIFADLKIESPAVQPSGTQEVVLRFPPATEAQHQDILRRLKDKYSDELAEVRFDSIGPTIGQELFRKAIVAVVLVTAMILFYIAWSFRKVSRPVASWVYGGIVVLTFLHDVIIPLGLFAILGHFKDWEIGSPFIAAVLTILGYSISDTIVVLDRVRENIKKLRGTFEEVVEASVHQTITRSINTSFTTMLALIAIFIFGGPTLQVFSLALLVGIAVGAYSSIFIAAPLLVVWQKWRSRR